MSKQAAEHHLKAAEHHEQAAQHIAKPQSDTKKIHTQRYQATNDQPAGT
jgi:hypothetical protein